VKHDSVILKFGFQKDGIFIKDETDINFFRSKKPSLIGDRILENTEIDRLYNVYLGYVQYAVIL